MSTTPSSPTHQALAKQALGLAWAGGMVGDFAPFAAFADRAAEHIPHLEIKDNGPSTGKQVSLAVLQDCCMSAVAASHDPVARTALLNTISAIDAAWPQSDWQKGINQLSFGQQMIEPVFNAAFFKQGTSDPSLTMEILRAVPALLFGGVRETGGMDRALLQAAVEKNYPDIVDALLRQMPHSALASVAAKMSYSGGRAPERTDALADVLFAAAKTDHTAPLDVLIRFSTTDEAAALGIKPVDEQRRCGLANLATKDHVRLHLVAPLLEQSELQEGVEDKLRHLYGLAVGAGHLDTAVQLRQHGFTKNAVMDAVYDDDAKVLWLEEALLAPEANVNEQYPDLNGSAPLHMAALRGNLETAARLLLEGADPKLLNSDGQTPYRVADKKIKPQFKAMLDARAAHGKVSDVVERIRRKAATQPS